MIDKIEKFAAERISLIKFEFNALFLFIFVSIASLIYNTYQEETLSTEEKQNLIAVLDSIAQSKAHQNKFDELQEIEETNNFENYNKQKTELKVDIRTASNLQLMELPGVGEKTALSIIKYRNKNGFKSHRDLLKIKGIGEKKLQKIKPFLITFGNTNEYEIVDNIKDNSTIKTEKNEINKIEENSKSDEISNEKPESEKISSSIKIPKSQIKIDLNSASLQELMSLPSIGEKTAKDIIEYRRVTRFEKIEDIMKIKGIGEKKFEKIKNFIEIR